MINKKLILASKSPRRYDLLSPHFLQTQVVTKNVEECCSETSPDKIVQKLSKLKLADLYKEYPNDIVVAGDTIVWFDGKVYGKPKDEKDAFKMLKELSGNCHQVYSGFAVSYKGKVVAGYDKSDIIFKNLSDNVINSYIQNYCPLDKAGSYGIQDGVVVESCSGDINTIIGLPVHKILKVCKELINL